MQRRPALCTGNPGDAFIVWQDDASGSYDVYVSMGYVPDLDIGIPEFSGVLLPATGTLMFAILLVRRRLHVR